MPGFESIFGQDRPIRILTTLLQTGTVPHALLFTGIEGVGKQSVAVVFAMACNCVRGHAKSQPEREINASVGGDGDTFRQAMTNPCGICRPCRKIESGNHPDIIRIKPAGAFIKIEQIRALCQTIAMKPYEAAMRVVIISDAQTMNPAAGNALLKVLEEPPPGTVLILIANHTSGLLPTIVSRCRHIRFNPLSMKAMESLLIRRHGLERGNAKIIASMAGGSLTRALDMYRTNWISHRNWLISELASLSSRPVGRLLAFGEHLAKNKDALPDTLEVMKSWLRDVAVGKLDPEKIIHQDLTGDMQRHSQKISMASLLSMIETIQSTQNSIRPGTNLRLAMDAMILKLSRI